MKKMMWAYLIHLSENMWGDPGSKIRYAHYCPELQTSYEVWRQVIDYLPAQGINTVLIDVGDAMEYESHPEVSIKGAWPKDKLKKELDYIRSLGMTPIPKLNFSAGHDAWLGVYSKMLCTPKYYEVCRDLIMEVAEVFGYPEYFHLGMDEEDAVMQGGLAYIVIRQLDLLWHDMYFFFDVCEKVGARPWVWAGTPWNEKLRKEYFERMPKSVLQSNFWYNAIRKEPDGSYRRIEYETYCMLEREGFDQVPCCSTFEGYQESALETMQLGKEEIHPDRLVGYVTASWVFTRENEQYRMLNDALKFGLAKKQVYPEEV